MHRDRWLRWAVASTVGCFLLAGCGSGVDANAPLTTTILVASKPDIGQTRLFTVPDRWAIAWQFHGCTKIPQVPYLQAAIYLPSNDIVRIAIRDFHGPSHHGLQIQQGAGTYYLGVSSTCPWTVRIMATSRPAQPK